jgi:hypothetical protein
MNILILRQSRPNDKQVFGQIGQPGASSYHIPEKGWGQVMILSAKGSIIF